MEYGLWRTVRKMFAERFVVLILVLMEYGLWPLSEIYNNCVDEVLILVLMEYGLWLEYRDHSEKPVVS